MGSTLATYQRAKHDHLIADIYQLSVQERKRTSSRKRASYSLSTFYRLSDGREVVRRERINKAAFRQYRQFYDGCGERQISEQDTKIEARFSWVN